MYSGGTSEFYFKHLAGIQQASNSRGWEQIVLKPVSTLHSTVISSTVCWKALVVAS